MGTGDNGGTPLDIPPLDFAGGPWDGTIDGPGTGDDGPLFPNGACAPPTAAAGLPCATQVDFTPSPVPEPNSLALFGMLLAGAAAFGARRTGRPKPAQASAV